MKEKIVYDIEVYPNYFLVGFKKIDNKKLLQIEVKGADSSLTENDVKNIKATLDKYTVVGFNSLRYDMPVLLKALERIKCRSIFGMSKAVVGEGLQVYQTYNRFDIEIDPARYDHIDISEPSPAVFVSLKAYGSRLYSQKLQDLPYPFDTMLTEAEMKEVKKYNENDLDTTIDLYEAIKDRIELREEMSKEYRQDLRSKSDAQIAEAVIISELKKAGVEATRESIPKTVRYIAPNSISFQTPVLKGLLQRIQAEPFKINQKNGSPELPDWLKKFPLKIGETSYQIGVGGLHSKEKSMVVIPNDDEILKNVDVDSYYPSMILEYGFYPKRLTARFLTVYGNIYKKRLQAKSDEKKLEEGTEAQLKAKTVNAGFKIVLNGSFGKLGSMYSKLYAPDLMLQVTITGQLMLLMLIEELELQGFVVKSSNTDGVEILCPKSKQALLDSIVFDWEVVTGMNMSHGKYNALYARDVNNYVAVYEDEVKAKGVYAPPTLSKNSEYPIVFEAIRQFLFKGTRMEDTIRGCSDITQFLTARTVKGGGVWNDVYLGKVVRWYYSKNGNSIHYQTNGNKVPKSDGAKPMMELTKAVPSDLDYKKYIDLAIGHLQDLGVEYVDE